MTEKRKSLNVKIGKVEKLKFEEELIYCAVCPNRDCPRSCDTYHKRHGGKTRVQPRICLKRTFYNLFRAAFGRWW